MSYENKKHRKTSQTTRRITTLVIVILLLFVLLFILEKTGVTNFYEKKQSTASSDAKPQDAINFNPPTEQEAKSGDEQKQSLPDADSEPAKPNTANVVIVDANQYGDEIEVRAFVSNTIEDGKCTITFTQGTSKLVKTVNAFADATTTPCMNLVVPRGEFSTAGDWNIEVYYESSELTGLATSSLTIE